MSKGDVTAETFRRMDAGGPLTPSTLFRIFRSAAESNPSMAPIFMQLMAAIVRELAEDDDVAEHFPHTTWDEKQVMGAALEAYRAGPREGGK